MKFTNESEAREFYLTKITTITYYFHFINTCIFAGFPTFSVVFTLPRTSHTHFQPKLYHCCISLSLQLVAKLNSGTYFVYLLTPNVRQTKHTNNIHYHNNNTTSRRNYYKYNTRKKERKAENVFKARVFVYVCAYVNAHTNAHTTAYNAYKVCFYYNCDNGIQLSSSY